MMAAAGSMVERGAHYTSLVELLEDAGASRLNQRERDLLLAAADALLFGETDREWRLREAEDLIESLEASQRWSPEGCDELREHLYGCDAPSDG
jgi:hypothetical protein